MFVLGLYVCTETLPEFTQLNNKPTCASERLPLNQDLAHTLYTTQMADITSLVMTFCSMNVSGEILGRWARIRDIIMYFHTDQHKKKSNKLSKTECGKATNLKSSIFLMM